jgi:hypothetical protein
LRFDNAREFASNGLANVKEKGKWKFINRNGQIVLFEDLLCGTKLMKNARDEIVWPRKSAGQICAEQDARQENKSQ